MRLNFISVLLASVMLVACSTGESDSSASSASLQTTLATLPATIEGELIAGDDEGDDEGGIPEFTFGSITVGEENVDVIIPPEMLASAALPDNIGKVRATLGSVTKEYGGFSYYKVTKLERL